MPTLDGLYIAVYEYDGGRSARSDAARPVGETEPTRVTEECHLMPVIDKVSQAETWVGVLECQVTCQPVNPYRTEWNIGLAYAVPRDWYDQPGLCTCYESGPTASKLFQFTFDIIENRIKFRQYSLPVVTRDFMGKTDARRSLSWVRQADALNFHLIPGILGDQVMTTNCGMDCLQPMWPDADELAERRLANPPLVRYPAPFTAHTERMGLVYGDDDFTVLLGCRGYVVWDFRRRSADTVGPLLEGWPVNDINDEWSVKKDASDEEFSAEATRLSQLKIHGLSVARWTFVAMHVNCRLGSRENRHE